MNKTGQEGGMSIFAILIIAIIFILVFSGAIAPILQVMIPISITNGELTGLEAFLIANFGLWIFIIFIIAVLWWSRT
jgi:hypothetical protein